MSNPAPIEKTVVKVKGRDVILDPGNMRFNEVTLSDYMSHEYGWIDYLGKQLEYANKEYLDSEIDFEAVYSKSYITAKEEGKAEGFAKAIALADPLVVAARKLVADRKETVGLIKAHLKAWDKNHDNAQNRGHTLRKEMDILGHNTIKVDPTDEATCSVEDFLK